MLSHLQVSARLLWQLIDTRSFVISYPRLGICFLISIYLLQVLDEHARYRFDRIHRIILFLHEVGWSIPAKCFMMSLGADRFDPFVSIEYQHERFGLPLKRLDVVGEPLKKVIICFFEDGASIHLRLFPPTRKSL